MPAIHSLALALLANLAVQLRVLAGPDLPFSRPELKGMPMAPTTMVAGSCYCFPSGRVFWIAYSRPLTTGLFVGFLILASVLAPVVVEKAIRSRVERLEFAG